MPKNKYEKSTCKKFSVLDQNVNALDRTFKCNIKNLYDRIFMMLMTSFVDL